MTNRILFWDLGLNYSALALTGMCGLLINLIIANYYPASILGQFNIIYAFYIILGQFCCLGIHYSVLKHIAHSDSAISSNKIICNAIILSCLLGIICIIIILLLKNFLANLLGSPNISKGLLLLSPSILLFGVNKILLFALNGMKKMRSYAIGQAIRYISMLIFIATVSSNKLSEIMLNGMYLFAESILFIFLFSLFIRKHNLYLAIDKNWIKKHFNFGTKAALSGIFVELNTRVDVLILSVFTTNKMVGIYSFALFFIEGLYQGIVLLRNQINPYISQYSAQKLSFPELSILLNKIKLLSVILVPVGTIILLLSYYYLTKNIPKYNVYHQGFTFIAILAISMSACSLILPFDNILAQSNKPALQSKQSSYIILFNLILNLILTYQYHAVGSAIAVAIANYFFSSFLIWYYAKKHININLLGSGTTC